MTREEQIREAACNLRIFASRANKATFAREVFEAGAKWADENPCMPDKVVKIPERSREEIKELLANWKGTLLVGDDISLSPWISVKDGLPSINNYGESKMVFVRVINKDTKAEWIEQPAKYNINIKDWIAMDFTHIGKRNGMVTHWMPIPKLQEE